MDKIKWYQKRRMVSCTEAATSFYRKFERVFLNHYYTEVTIKNYINKIYL